MFSSFQALPCVHGVRPRDRRTINDAKKFPPLHAPQRAIVSGQLSALIGVGFECCKVLMPVEGQSLQGACPQAAGEARLARKPTRFQCLTR